MSTNSKEAILAAARLSVQTHGYHGLNFRDLATEVGIKAASIYHHFPSKAALGTAVARRYWEDTAAELDLLANSHPTRALREYPKLWRRALEGENRLCLGSFMSTEYDDLPAMVREQVQEFANVNVAWLSKVLVAAGVVSRKKSDDRARAIFAAVSGAQLMARGRADLSLFDELIESYRSAGLLPA
ncbi:MAG TPA: TetR/AcrR family transcriptional regulator [Chthoniobacterales bacterium]|jgi:TetR/AcrR family transcriptional repressor of nem operon|nr:TetR/AcrR family transcriptional regulator [Chthoniobacterales bacterium]